MAEPLIEGNRFPARRTVLQWVVGAIGGGAVIAGLIPFYFYLSPKRQARGGNLFTDPQGAKVSPAQVRQQGAVVGLAFGKPAIAFYHEGKLQVFSAVCTHLGCIVKWVPGEAVLFCPCHAGKFDIAGRVTAGPPSAPLRHYPVRGEDDQILVSEA